MKKLTFIICFLLSFALYGEEEGSEQDSPDRLYVIGFSSTLDFYHLNEGRTGLAPTSLAELSAVSGKYSAALALDLSHLFETHSLDTNDDFDWESFVKEANVQIQDIGGEPVTIVVGKQVIPFGQGFTRQPLPFFWNNPTVNTQIVEGVMGVSVKLSELPLFQELVDEVEFSVFESSREWDFDIQGKPAFSIRMNKTLETDEHEHTITASYVNMDNDHLKPPLSIGIDDNEERISLGFISESVFTEDLLLWGETIYFENNPYFRSPSRLLLSTGTVYQVGDKTFWTGEYNTMERRHKSYATGLWYRPVSRQGYQLSVGLEYRYTDYDLTKNESQVGVILRIQNYRAKGFRF